MAVQSPGNDKSPPLGTLGDALSRAQITPQSVGASAGAPAGNAGQDQNTQQQNNASRGYGRGKGNNSLMNFNNIAVRPASRYSAGAVVRAFESSFKKVFTENIDPEAANNYAYLLLDSQNQGLSLSSILYCYMLSHEGRNYVAVFNMVIEASGPRLSSRMISVGDRQVEQLTVPGDVIDQYMWDKVLTFVTERFGRDTVVLNAGAMVLPNTLNAENHEALRGVFYYTTNALFTALNNNVTHTETPLSLNMIDSSITLNADVSYTVPVVENTVGQPQRSDISITLRASQPQGNALSAQHDATRDLTRVDGYIDLQYSEPGPLIPGQIPTTQRYFPRYVITRIDSLMDAITPEHMLLGLSTATLLSSNYAWAGVYMNRYGVTGRDLRDIGAIGYEINLSGDPTAAPDRIDTRSETFTRNSLVQLLNMAFHAQVVYSMDVEEVGELAWIHQAFIAAANNDQNAYRSIIVAADNLTNGAFSQYWNNGPIAVDDYNRIHLGHYTAPNGEVRDIRDLDYLGLLNLVGDRDMQAVVDWSMTFDDTTVPVEIRLEKRAKILQAALPNCVITGFGRRITFHKGFIEALLKACAQAGLVVRQQNVAFLEGATNRGSFDASAFAVGGAGPNAGVFTFGGQAGYGNRGNQGFLGQFANYYNPVGR